MRLVSSLVVLSIACLGACTEPTETDPEPVEVESTGPDAAADVGEEMPQPLAFMSQCESDDQCESGLCFEFNTKGPHCTHECETDLECDDPSPGCNGKGVCKAPGDDGGGGGGGGGGG